MNDNQVRYLRAINQQLGGPIRAAIPDKMTGFLLECVYSLCTRVLVDIELAEQLRESQKSALLAQRSALVPILAASDEGRCSLTGIEEITAAGASADQIESITARVAAFLVHASTPESLQLAQRLDDLLLIGVTHRDEHGARRWRPRPGPGF